MGWAGIGAENRAREDLYFPVRVLMGISEKFGSRCFNGYTTVAIFAQKCMFG